MQAEPGLDENDFPLLRTTDAGYAYRLCEETMRPAVVTLWGRWPEKKVKAEMMRAVVDGEMQSVLDRGTRVGLVSVLWSETCCEIAQLFIEPKHQGRGLGRSTVDRIIHQASRRASRPVIARVLLTNPARAFWEKVGFRVVDTTAEHHLLERRT